MTLFFIQRSSLLPKLSNKTYFYRFIYGEATSPIGRCRTLPAEKDQLKEPLRLGVVTCNDYSSGYFNAFYHLAEEDINFVVHLTI